MKRLLTLFAALAFVACDNDSGNKGGGEPDYDFERTAEYLYVYFYGDEYSQEQGTVDYFISLSDSPLGGDVIFEWLYTIDLYANEGSLDKIPNGTYNLDLDSSCMGGTLAYADCVYFEGTEYESPFTEAKLVVNDSEIVLTVTTEDGKTHKVTYSGDYEVIDDREDGGSDDEGDEGDEGYGDEGYGDWATTLTGDVEVEYNENMIYAEYWGDDYDMGYNILVFYFETEDYIGDSLQIEVAVEDADFVGTYSPCKTWDNASIGNLIAANIYDGDPYGGCWYFRSEDGEYYDDCAPLVAGSLTITDNGDNTYTFSYEGYDALEGGNKVSLNWTGEVRLEDYTQEASAKQRISPLRREVKMMPVAAHSHKKMAAKFRK